MAVSLIGVGTTNVSLSSSLSGAVTTHASTQIGDVLVLSVNFKKTATTPVPTTPAGWTLLLDRTVNNVGHMVIYTKVATVAGAQSITVSWDVGSLATLIVASLRGANTPVILGSNTYTTTTTPALAAVTTTEAAEFLYRILAANSGSNQDQSTLTWGGPTQATYVQGQGVSAAAYDTGPTPAGAVAAKTVTLPLAPSGSATVTIGVPAAPTGAPANTVAPVASGTASVGSVLSTTTGTWDQAITSYTYQWKRDGVDISGATASSYTVVSGDAGHTLTVVVSATNTNGTGTATSNGIAIPAAPVNTVAPVVTTDGTPATGETVTCSTGTWTGTGITYTYQWYRGASAISGETTSSYVLAVTDEGASITCRVTATNGGGAVTANSNAIVPAVTAPLSDDSFLTYLSGGVGNSDPALSIGGARGGTLDTSLNGLIGPIVGSVAQAGGTFYRVVYVRNTHTTATAAGCKLFIEQQFSNPGIAVAVAVPAEGVNTTVPALASQTTAPSGVTWTTTTTAGDGLDFGALGPGQYRGIYVQITVDAGTVATNEDDAIIAVEGSAA